MSKDRIDCPHTKNVVFSDIAAQASFDLIGPGENSGFHKRAEKGW